MPYGRGAGYLVEGHIPPAYVKQLLSERPRIRGITLPEMPTGVGGMMGSFNGLLEIVTLDAHPGVWRTITSV